MVYLLYYGMVLDNEEYNSICFILKFKEAKYGDVKARLVNQEATMTKKAKFYQMYSHRKTSNRHFMAAWRFFLYDGDKLRLGKVRSATDVVCNTRSRRCV